MLPTSHLSNSDLFELEHVFQQSGVVYSKSVLIDVLRDVFSRDRQFCYKSDLFGYPLTPNQLGLDPGAGYEPGDDSTTRIFIGSSYRYDVKFNPSIIVRNTSSRYSPISFNQNRYNVVYDKQVLEDGYGNYTYINVPVYHTIVGAWDQNLEVKIIAEDQMDREELADIVQVVLIGSRRQELQNAGIFIKTLSSGGESEVAYGNEHLYVSAITLEVRSEFKVCIPISNLCEKIGMCLSFGALDDYSNALAVNDVITAEDLL